MQKGEIVLVQAGASGVGRRRHPASARAGRRIDGACHPPPPTSGLERLKGAWPQPTASITSANDVPTEVARLTDKHMADVIVDSVGGATLQFLDPVAGPIVAGSRWSARRGAASR